jgi:hypothetical protein
VTALRTPIARAARPRFSDEALDAFRQLRRLRRVACSCPPPEPDPGACCARCARERELLGRLFHVWPRVRPWWFPIVAPPDEPCPFAEGHHDRQRWLDAHAEASARWQEIEQALLERERRRRQARRAAMAG